jgi:hypothetical protein
MFDSCLQLKASHFQDRFQTHRIHSISQALDALSSRHVPVALHRIHGCLLELKGGCPPLCQRAMPCDPAGSQSRCPGCWSSSQFFNPIYDSSPYILLITWGRAAGTVIIWRDKLRSAWCKQGYDYDAFKLFARMGGSPVRVRLLNILWQVLQGTAPSLQMSLTLTGRP